MPLVDRNVFNLINLAPTAYLQSALSMVDARTTIGAGAIGVWLNWNRYRRFASLRFESSLWGGIALVDPNAPAQGGS